ncbi:MAG: rhodanese-like domain-containing protein [Edaphobacter sp.]
MRNRFNRLAAAFFVLMMVCIVASTAGAQTSKASQIPAADLVQPAELAQILQSKTEVKPLLLQVGSHVLYAQAHIPGSEYVGAGGQPAGLQALRERVSKLDKSAFVVLYCGCCPWGKCPNIAPAYNQMRSMGFTHLKVLYIADNFGTDWVDKGYPATTGR